MITHKSKPAKVFGEVLKELRLERGLTQDELAEKAMLNDRSHVSALERATKSPSLPTLFTLADALNIMPSELLRLVEDRL